MAVTRLNLVVTGSSRDLLAKLTSRIEGAFAPDKPEIEYVRDVVGNVASLRVLLDDAVLPSEQQLALFRSLANLAGRAEESFTFSVGAADAASLNFDTEVTGVAPGGLDVVGTVVTETEVSVGPTTIHTDGGGASTHDLSTTDITVDIPIVPGTLVLSGTISATTETATDDGLGAFPTSTLLPSGGTIDYATGEMTGTTANLDASSDLDETHTKDVANTPLNSVQVGSGAAAGTASVSQVITSSAGGEPSELSWSANVMFGVDFGLNNNSVTGAQTLQLDLLLYGGTAAGDIRLQWAEVSDDATPPTAWGTPTFVGTAPSESPTSALAIDMDGVFHSLEIRKVSDNVLGVSYDGTEETFTFATPILVPSKIEISHTWGDALDRHFNVDDWDFSTSFGSTTTNLFSGLQTKFSA